MRLNPPRLNRPGTHAAAVLDPPPRTVSPRVDGRATPQHHHRRSAPLGVGSAVAIVIAVAAGVTTVAAVVTLGLVVMAGSAEAAEATAGSARTVAAHTMAETVVGAPAASVDQVLANLRSWVVGILAGLAAVFLTLGGIRYVMAGGDPGEIEKAKSAFRGAGIGYGLAVLAPMVVSVLRGIVGS